MQRNIYHTEIIDQILEALKLEKGNSFPDHVCGQAAMIAVPYGQLISSAVEYKYNRDKEQIQTMKTAAIQIAVQAIRMIEHLPKTEI